MKAWTRSRSPLDDEPGPGSTVTSASFTRFRQEIFQYWDAQQSCNQERYESVQEHYELVESFLRQGIDYQKRILQHVERLENCALPALNAGQQPNLEVNHQVNTLESLSEQADIAGRSTPAMARSATSPRPSRSPSSVLCVPPLSKPNITLNLPGQPQDDRPTRTMTLQSSLSGHWNAVENQREEWAQHLRRGATRFLDENQKLRHNSERHDPPEQQGLVLRVVQHMAFQWFSTFIILSSALFEGHMADVGMKHTLEAPLQADPDWFMPVAGLLAFLFGVEVLLRLCAYGKLFFTGPVRLWNAFDTVLVLSSLLEFLQPAVGIGSLSFLRGLRLFRVLRVIRVFRIFRDLRLMVCMIAQSMWSLFWALMLLILIMYLFAIIFMQSVIIHLRSNAISSMDPTFEKDIEVLYGSIWESLYTLLAAITGGIDWIQATTCLQQVSPVLKALFAIYIFFVVIGVLNVLTGVFVERASELSGLDKDLVIQSELRRNKHFLTEMTKIFHEADVDKSGTLSWSEFRDYLQDATVQAYLSTQQLDAFDARTLFDLLKLGSRDEIDMDEFIIGCQRLKGQARSVEVIAVLNETRDINKKLRTASKTASTVRGA